MPTVLVNLLQTTGTKGGIEAYVKELYTAIGKNKHNWEFIGFASKELFKSGDYSWFPGKVIDSGISGENRIQWAFGELFAVSKKAKELKVDLIHCPAMFGPIKSNIPVVITIHDLSYFTHPELMKTKTYTKAVKLMEKVAATNAARIIAISNATLQEVIKHLNFPVKKIDLVLSAGRTISKRSLDVKRESDLFLAMGQRSPYKSLETAVIAWSLMPVENRPRLVITGSHGKDPLKKLVRSLSLESSVELLEWVSDEKLDHLMRSCTAIIETTKAAGFGMPALEAMSISTPVIISDIPVFREIAGNSAEFFEAGNSQALADTVLQLQNDEVRLKYLQEQGPSRAEQFKWEETTIGTLRSFSRAIS